MTKQQRRMSRGRLAAAVIGTATLALSLSGVTSATGADGGHAAGSATVKKVFIRANLQKEKLFFDAPKSVHRGDTLKIINTTDPQQIGPHTFSLVEGSLRPNPKGGFKGCYEKDGICSAIFGWHRNGKTLVSKAGKKGWDTMGNLDEKGDSWFTDEQNSKFKQTVRAKPGALTFMCAIHPNMQGKILVKA